MKEAIYPIEPDIKKVERNITELAILRADELREMSAAREKFDEFKLYLNNGWIRAAEKDVTNTWHVNSWVKQGILTGFRLGVVVPMAGSGDVTQFFDKDSYPLRAINGVRDGVRIVPGGTAVRDGSYLGRGVTLMPPCYVNVGSYIGRDTMIDSEALVGSCAQVGQRCHIAAGAIIGGVLEPVNANPCIVEDDVMMGIHTSIAEGVILRNGVVLAPGVQITSATPVYDTVRETIYTAANGPLEIPEGAVVVPGSRPMTSESTFITGYNLMVQTPIIIKYRDHSTDAKTALENALR
jgi:2,3,4,5-tetrahydropyridine-2,6-dicarboxylate N-succinyltransferase